MPLAATRAAAVQEQGARRVADSDAVRQQQVEWEKQLELLDEVDWERNKLNEEGVQLHQSQLRLVRQNLVVLGSDLAALRREVATLRTSQTTWQSSREQSGGTWQEARVGDLEDLRAQLRQFEATVDDGLQGLRGEVARAHQRMEELQQHQQASLPKGLSAEVQELRRLLGVERQAREDLHSDIQQSVQRHFAYEKVERELRTSSSHERLDRLEEVLAGAGGALLHPSSHQRGGQQPPAPGTGLCAHVNKQAAALEEARNELGQLRVQLSECERLGESVRTIADGQAKLMGDKSALDARFAWVKERIDGLEDSLSASTQELCSLSASQARQAAELEAHCSLATHRLSGLERAFSEVASAHNDDRDAARQKVAEIQAQLAENASSSQGRLRSLEGALQVYLEAVMGPQQAGASSPEEGSEAKRATGDLASRHDKRSVVERLGLRKAGHGPP